MFNVRSLAPLPISFSDGFPLRREAQFLTEFGHKAAQVVREIRASDTFWVAEKGDGSCVTTADPVVQILFALEVESTFPGDAIVAEEDAASLAAFPDDQLFDIMHWVRKFSPPNYTKEVYEARLRAWADHGRGRVGKRWWALDPTDATTELVKDRDYSINGHLVEDGEVRLGFMACPNLRLPSSPESNRGELLVAVMGHGAYACGLTEDTQFHQLRVSGRRTLAEAIPIRPGGMLHVIANPMTSFLLPVFTRCWNNSVGGRTASYVPRAPIVLPCSRQARGIICVTWVWPPIIR